METIKLYQVTLRNNAEYLVLATNLEDAWQIVKKFIDKNDWHFHADRDIKTVELIGENRKYPNAFVKILLITGEEV